MNKTPKIFHQTYKSFQLPQDLYKYREKWKTILKNYEIPFYDDLDLRNLIKNNFPEYLEFYDSMTLNIERVDFARYIILYLYGGIYADLDTYPLKNIDLWVEKNKIIFGREPLEHSRNLYNREIVICNAFMVSPPKLSFWKDLMEYIIENYEYNYDAVYNTGPMMITRFYEKHPEKFKDIIITEPCVFFPLTGKNKISKECDINDSYVIHVWKNSWVKNIFDDPKWLNKRYWLYFLFIVIMILCIYKIKN